MYGKRWLLWIAIATLLTFTFSLAASIEFFAFAYSIAPAALIAAFAVWIVVVADKDQIANNHVLTPAGVVFSIATLYGMLFYSSPIALFSIANCIVAVLSAVIWYHVAAICEEWIEAHTHAR